MNDFEHTVKTALNDRVDEHVGPQRTPPAFDATRSTTHRSGTAPDSRWLRPLLAATAVVAVAIGATVTVGAISSTHRVAPATPGPVQTATPPAPSTPPSAATGAATTAPTQTPVAPPSATATTATTPTASTASTTWTTYHNDRYGFSAQIPAELTTDGPPINDAGLTYRSKDGHVGETASASATPAGATVTSLGAKYATELRRRGELTYTHVDVTAKTFTVTGYLYGGLYVEYVRGVVGSQNVYMLVWTYPTSQRSTADAWVRHSAATFQPGPL